MNIMICIIYVLIKDFNDLLSVSRIFSEVIDSKYGFYVVTLNIL